MIMSEVRKPPAPSHMCDLVTYELHMNLTPPSIASGYVTYACMYDTYVVYCYDNNPAEKIVGYVVYLHNYGGGTSN